MTSMFNLWLEIRVEFYPTFSLGFFSFIISKIEKLEMLERMKEKKPKRKVHTLVSNVSQHNLTAKSIKI